MINILYDQDGKLRLRVSRSKREYQKKEGNVSKYFFWKVHI